MLFLLLVSLGTDAAWAAGDSREKQMLRRMQQQVQQLDQARAQAEQDKAAALADKDALAREVETLRSSSAAAKREHAARIRLEGELKTVQAELETLKAKLADTEKRLADSQALQQTTAQALAQTESAKKRTEGELAGKTKDLQVCRTNNGALYGLGREMMQKYRDKSCQDALAQAEPFTGLKKVEVENLLEAWRDSLDREKLGAAAAP
ncbi:MAG: hypothetical protein J0626_11550 [Rhodospirillaceae bacterium]|nr:hypothetical protein [Rhodospirillaceae bacterium]